MSNNLPTLEQLLENRPTLSSILNRRPEAYRSNTPSFMDTLFFTGATLGLMMMGLVLFNDKVRPDVLLPLIFITMLTIHILSYKSEEKKDIQLQKQWVGRQPISADLRTRYIKKIDNDSASILWLITRFLLVCICWIPIIAFYKFLFGDRKSH